MHHHTPMRKLLLALLLSHVGLHSAHAQWVQTNGPYGGYINCFTVSGTNLFAGTSGGVFLSTNNGTSWTAVNNGLTNTDVRALAVSGTNLFAGTSGGVFLSTNNGTSWTAVNTGLTNTHVRSLAVSGTNLFAGTWGGGVWRRPLTEMITGAIVFTETATNVTSTSATLNGTVNPNGLATTAYFEWGTSSTLATFSTTPFQSIGSGTSVVSVTANLSGLSVNTTYYYRVVGQNSAGTQRGSIVSFTTAPAAPTLASPANGATGVSTNPTLSWNPSTGAASYQLQVSANSAFSALVVNQTGITATSYTISGLANSTTYFWRVSATNAGGTSSFSNTFSFTTIVAAPSAPTLSFPANGATNQPTTLTLSWSTVTGATTYRLQVSTNSTFTPLVVDDSTLTTSSRQIGPLANNTVYYWRVNARNAGGTSPYTPTSTFSTAATTTISMTVPLFFPSNPTSSTDYRLVSVPGASFIIVSQILSGAQRTDWRIYRDNGASSNFLVELSSSSTLTTGEGYWLLKKGPLNISRSVTMPALSPDGTYSIPLRPGWNIIANPFDRSVPWSAVRSVNQFSSSLLPLAYTGTYSSSSTLEPFAGYYFDNRTAGLSQLKIPYPFPAMKVADPEPPRIDWQLQLVFSSDINEDRENYAGIAPSSSLERDELDVRKPPLFLDQGFLYFDRPAWDSEYRRFAADFRPTLGEGQVWDFEVSNPRLSLAKISVHGVERIPADYDIKLINLANTVPVDLRSTNEYSYQTVSERMKFKLVVGKKSYVQKEVERLIPETYALEQNYPNPFNPSTSIMYRVPRESYVRLEVLSSVGQVITTLVDGRVPAGTYTALWNATDHSGVRVASGVYFYRMLVDGAAVSTRRMIVLK